MRIILRNKSRNKGYNRHDGVFHEESINIKIGFWKECESDDSRTFMASMATPSSTGTGMVSGG